MVQPLGAIAFTRSATARAAAAGHKSERDLNRPAAMAAQKAVSRKSSANSLGLAIQLPARQPSSVPPTQGRNMASPEPSTKAASDSPSACAFIERIQLPSPRKYRLA